MRAGIAASAGLFAILILSGCVRPSPKPLPEGESFESVLDDPRWGESVRRARARLYERIGRRRLKTGVRRELLPPVGHDEAGIALSHWLLRLEGTLAPSIPASPMGSVASAQQLFRDRRDEALEFWMIDVTTPPPSLRFEIVVVRALGTIRSGEQSIRLAEPVRLWPFDPAFARATGRLVGAHELASVHGTNYAIGIGGPWELKLDGRRIRGTQRGVEPYRLTARDPLPPVERLDRDVMLRFLSVIDSSGASLHRFELRRGMHAWSMDVPGGKESPIRALAARVSKDPYDWIVLRDDGSLEIHRRALRMAAPPRATALVVDRTAVRAYRPPANSARDPLRVWTEAYGREPVPLGTGVELRSKRLDIRVGCRSTAERWKESLIQRLGAKPTDHDWLLAPLRDLRVRTDGDGLRLESDELPPDILQRLAHPALWPDRSVPEECLYRQPRPDLQWVDSETEADARWVWPSRVGEGVPPGDDGVIVAIVPSAVADPTAIGRLAAILAPVDLPELFAVDAPAWIKRLPATARPWSELPALEPALAGDPRTLVLFVDETVLDIGERGRLLERLRVLLQPEGFRLQTHRLGETELSIPPRAIVASLLRVGLFTGDPLLRALELRSWTTFEPPDESLREAQRWAPQRTERLHVAERLEEELLRSGRIIPLWRERWQARLDPRLEQLSGPMTCIPPPLASLRWHPAAIGLDR